MAHQTRFHLERQPLDEHCPVGFTPHSFRILRFSGLTWWGCRSVSGIDFAGLVRAGVVEAQDAMTGLKAVRFEPDLSARATYDRLFQLYTTLHDAFGGVISPTGHPRGGNSHELRGVMKELIAIREQVRGAHSSP